MLGRIRIKKTIGRLRARMKRGQNQRQISRRLVGDDAPPYRDEVIDSSEPTLSLLRLADWACTAPVVFITGVPRSGTSRFYDALTQAPPFHRQRGSYIETHLVSSLDKLYQYRKIDPLYRYLGQPGPKQAGLDQFIAMIKNQSPVRKRQAFVQAFFYFAFKYGQSKMLAEKTPLHSRSIDFLKYCLPASRMFFLYRHPVSIFASMRRRMKMEMELSRDPQGWEWMDKTPHEFALFYRAICSDALRARTVHPDAVYLMSYEEFVGDPVGTCEAAFRWLDIEFEPAFLDPSHEPGNPIDELLYRPVRDYGQKWQEQVTEDEAAQIQSELADLMGQLSIEPY